jgi:hypothetical protein
MTFDSDDIAEPARAIGRAFAYWSSALGRKPKRLSTEDANRVLQALAPSCDIVRIVRQTLDEREDRLVQLTAEQARIVHFLDEQLHAAVHGAAGTGKTLVAVEKARRIASPAQPVLFLCFNSALQAHLAAHHQQPNVRYLTFHGLSMLNSPTVHLANLPKRSYPSPVFQ